MSSSGVSSPLSFSGVSSPLSSLGVSSPLSSSGVSCPLLSGLGLLGSSIGASSCVLTDIKSNPKKVR